MNSERIKKLQEQTAYPESTSVMLALKQVWNEVQQENNKDIETYKNRIRVLQNLNEKYREKLGISNEPIDALGFISPLDLNKMEKIKINGTEYMFEVERKVNDFYDYYTTYFYFDFDTVTKKKYILFGKKYTVNEPKYAFEIELNLKSCEISKNNLKEKLEKKEKEFQDKIKRCKEIENSDFI